MEKENKPTGYCRKCRIDYYDGETVVINKSGLECCIGCKEPLMINQKELKRLVNKQLSTKEEKVIRDGNRLQKEV